MAAEETTSPVSGAMIGGGGSAGETVGVPLGDDDCSATGDDPVHPLSTEQSASKAINARREFDGSFIEARRC